MLYLYNTLTKKKELFEPIDKNKVRMYVCGPTVYDYSHIGNARSAVIFDVLYRILCELYGDSNVRYAKNITDIDDKIIAAAKEKNVSISDITHKAEKWYHNDMEDLNVLAPNYLPHATHNVREMVDMIQALIDNGHAYISEGHVLFSVDSYKEHGKLSGRIQEDLLPGARVKVESYKKNPADFVLWKPAVAGEDLSCVFNSPWGLGRPGWHIECSAMSTHCLGKNFDIHGGGADLMFPHHENEIAQAVCAYPGTNYAKYWVHNGFLTVNGKKMSKSDGNFITVKQLLDNGVNGETIRLALLSTKYNEPLDWSDKLLEDAKKQLDTLYRRIYSDGEDKDIREEFQKVLFDDLNTPAAISLLFQARGWTLKKLAGMLGLLKMEPEEWFKGEMDLNIEKLISLRNEARKAKNFKEADRIREELLNSGIILEDSPDGTTDWRKV